MGEEAGRENFQTTHLVQGSSVPAHWILPFCGRGGLTPLEGENRSEELQFTSDQEGK